MRRPGVWTVGVVGVVLAVGVAARFVSLSELWLDEALTVNLAQLPWGQLEPALRHDGAPPLYYALAHVWIDVFGDSNVAVRALSGVISVATLPLAYFAGRRLGGARLGWITVLVLVASPYAIRYASETRMYSLEMLLVLAGFLVLVGVLERPSIGRLAALAGVTALLLYNQYWSPYLIAVVVVGLVFVAFRGDALQRGPARRAIAAIALGGIAFLPWVPTLRYQLAHTGTPWGEVYLPPAGFGLTAIEFGGARFASGWLLAGLLVILAFLGMFARTVDDRRLEIDLRAVPATRAVAGVALGTLVLGLTATSLSGNTFEGRYAAVVFPLFVLLVARGLDVFGDVRVRNGLVAVVVVIGLVVGWQHAQEARTQADQAAAVIRAESQPGEVVVYCPDQLGPSVSRLLEGTDLVQLTFPDGDPPEQVDWVDYVDRVTGADVDAFVEGVLTRAGSEVIWLVNASGYQHVETPCGEVDAKLSLARPAAGRLVVEDTGIWERTSLTRFAP